MAECTTAVTRYMHLILDGYLPSYFYLWAKPVTGFNPKVHCARGLHGAYDSSVTLASLAAGVREWHVERAEGDIVYLCGVTRRYIDNLHAPLRARSGSRVALPVPGGNGTLTVHDAELLLIPSEAELVNASEWPAAFRTCRNWRFGVGHYLSSVCPAFVPPSGRSRAR